MLRKICAASASLACLFTTTAAYSQAVEQLPPIVIEGVQPRAQQLQQLAVPPFTAQQTTAGPVDGYRALTAVSATRTQTPIEQIPQSIVVIPRNVIDDQFNQSVFEAVRNVSGVQATSPLQTPAYESTTIRGVRAELWVDGIVNYYGSGDRDSLVNVERIEVLKGANAVLYGAGIGNPFGGVINLVSKLPQNRTFSEFGVTIGSRGYVQPYFDINQPLSKDGTILFRITGEYTKSNSFIDVLELDRYSINPTLLFTNNSGTTLTLQGRLSKWQQQEYQGLPATGTITGPFRLDRNMFIGSPDIPRSNSQTQSFTAKLDHEFNSYWSGSLQTRVGKTEFQERAQNFVNILGADFTANAPVAAPSTWDLMNLLLFQQQQEFTTNAHVLAKFSTANTQNKFLFGVDYSRLTDKGAMLGDFFGATTIDLQNPIYPAYATPAYIPANVASDGNNTYVTQGVYAQLQSTVWDRLHLLGGVRLASMKIDSISPTFGTTDITEKTKLLPRVGAVFDLVKGFSLFASYSEGMRASPFSIYLPGVTPRPEESEQVEAGIKFNLASTLTGQLALFQIDRTGVAVGFPSNPIGEQRSRGFEADLIWQPTWNWQFIASYAHIDAVTTNAAFGVPAGNVVNLVAPDSGRVWANYRFDSAQLRGLSVGLGVYASSGAFLDLANIYKTESFFTIDAKVSYETPTWIASLIFKNLTREQYFVPYAYYGGRVAPGDDFAVYGKFAIKFGKQDRQ